jgi:HEAT repeat protein
VKVAIARVFQKTLVADGLQDRDAVVAMLGIAEERGTPLMLRMACIEASGEIGSPGCIESYSKILAQSDLDPLIKEATLQALCSLLSKYEGGTVTIGLPTLNRLTELVFGKDTPQEIRAKGLIVLARLQRLGVRGIDLLPRLLNILKTEENAQLVLAAVEALGILGEESGVPALVAAYGEFFDKANPTREADVRIRTAIVATLGDLLDAMGSKTGVNAAAAKQIVELLLKIVDPQAEPKEAEKVLEDAVFALRYLFHRKADFQTYIQKAAGMLILLLRKNAESGELKGPLVETLTIITRKPFTELARWEKWYDETYPAFKLPKPAP